MKEITKTIVEKYNDNGVLIERSETTTEKDLNIEKKYVPIPYYPTPVNPYNPIDIIYTGDRKPVDFIITCGSVNIKTDNATNMLEQLKRIGRSK